MAVKATTLALKRFEQYCSYLKWVHRYACTELHFQDQNCNLSHMSINLRTARKSISNSHYNLNGRVSETIQYIQSQQNLKKIDTNQSSLSFYVCQATSRLFSRVANDI